MKMRKWFFAAAALAVMIALTGCPGDDNRPSAPVCCAAACLTGCTCAGTCSVAACSCDPAPVCCDPECLPGCECDYDCDADDCTCEYGKTECCDPECDGLFMLDCACDTCTCEQVGTAIQNLDAFNGISNSGSPAFRDLSDTGEGFLFVGNRVSGHYGVDMQVFNRATIIDLESWRVLIDADSTYRLTVTGRAPVGTNAQLAQQNSPWYELNNVEVTGTQGGIGDFTLEYTIDGTDLLDNTIRIRLREEGYDFLIGSILFVEVCVAGHQIGPAVIVFNTADPGDGCGCDALGPAREALATLITTAQGRGPAANYSAASWAALQTAIASAQTAVEQATTETALTGAQTALQSAISGLVRVVAGGITIELRQFLDAAEGLEIDGLPEGSVSHAAGVTLELDTEDADIDPDDITWVHMGTAVTTSVVGYSITLGYAQLALGTNSVTLVVNVDGGTYSRIITFRVTN